MEPEYLRAAAIVPRREVLMLSKPSSGAIKRFFLHDLEMFLERDLGRPVEYTLVFTPL